MTSSEAKVLTDAELKQMDAGNNAKPWTKRDEVSYWKRMHEDQKEHNERLLATIDGLQALNKELVGLLGAFLGEDDKMQVAIGGNPNYVDRFLFRSRTTLLLSRAKDS